MEYEYQGDCITILDNSDLFGDATEMAQVIENSTPITKKDFKRLSQGKTGKFFSYGRYKDLLWSYDTLEDIHYFYL